MLKGKRILLIVAGGIAAFKSLELIRRLRERGASVRCVLTEAGAKFVTPLSLQALSEDRVYSDMFSLTDESEMGHIQLSRDADLLVVAPATANILARMARSGRRSRRDRAARHRQAVLLAPAMTAHVEPCAPQPTRDPKQRGGPFIGPTTAPCLQRIGPGRMSEPRRSPRHRRRSDAGRTTTGRKRAVVTSARRARRSIPWRYISNHSSGKQGHAIASALAALGADVTLVSGPVAIADPTGLRTVHVDSAEQMLAACLAAGRIDVAVCAAAVADWKAARPAGSKIKKKAGMAPPTGARAQSRHPRHFVQARPGAPGACRWLRRRDREPGGQCHRQAPTQGL